MGTPTNDGDAIGKLLDVLPRRVERVEVVKVTDGTEEVLCSAHFISNNDPAFPAALDLEELNNGSVALEHVPHDILIQSEGIFGRLVEESLVADRTNVDLAVGAIGVAGTGGGEGAARDKVAAQLLRVCGGRHARRAVRLDTEGLCGGGRVEEEVVDTREGETDSHRCEVRITCLFSQCAPGPLETETPGRLVWMNKAPSFVIFSSSMTSWSECLVYASILAA